MKIILLTYPWYSAPYIELLKNALLEYDKSFEITVYSDGVAAHLSKIDLPKVVLHIQWPDALYNSKLSFIRNFSVVLRFLRQARGLKKNGAKIVWTVHDYRSHNCKFPLLDKFFYQALFFIVDKFIVHTEVGRLFLEQKGVSAGKISIIPHGNFIGYNGNAVDKEKSRKALGIFRDDAVFLNIGFLCDYKGLDTLVDVFNEIEEPTLKLIIVGKKHQRFNLDRLLFSVRRPEAISISDVFVSPEEMPPMLGAADFFIMAHRNFLSSGAAILALSYGLPVIAPRCGDMSFLVRDGYNGFLYESGNKEELKKIVLEATALSEDKKREMSKNAIESVRPYSWDFVVRETLKVYQN